MSPVLFAVSRARLPHAGTRRYTRFLRSEFRLSAVLLLLLTSSSALAAPKALTLTILFDAKPLKGAVVTFGNESATTDSRGVARFPPADLGVVLPPYSFDLDSPDLVLTDIRGAHDRWAGDAVYGATWRQRTQPRICDEWMRASDIPVGMLRTMTAQEYDRWYSSLTPQEIRNCEILTSLEKRVGSKAPWYFYEFKALKDRYKEKCGGPELDWVAWYRGLLEEATHASPGKCVTDWESWWAKQGYAPIPALPVTPSRYEGRK